MIAQERGTNGDGHIHIAGEIEVADGTAVDTTIGRFQFVDDFHRARLGSSGERACRERGLEHVKGG